MTSTPQIVDSLDGVLSKLEDIITMSIQQNDRTGYFAALYHKVTAKVKEDVAAGQFGDGLNITKLDIQFANRYFYAFEQWHLHKPVFYLPSDNSLPYL